MEMAKTLKAIDPCLYEKLLQIYKANEILRLQEETCLDKIEQDIKPMTEFTVTQDGRGQERSLTASSDVEKGVQQKAHDDVNSHDVGNSSNNSTPEHHEIPASYHLPSRPLEGWTTVESIPQLKKTKKTPRKPLKKKFRKFSRNVKKKSYRC